ncbi:MAG: histidine triad nucleotide-binding protein [Acidobacteriota bacterium]
MNDCVFCKIVAGTIPATLLYEDEFVVAFSDLNPQAPTHLLVIPRQHIDTLNEIGPEDSALIGRMVAVATSLAKSRGLHSSGYRCVLNCNADGGQSVFHIHLHLLAGRKLTWPPG